MPASFKVRTVPLDGNAGTTEEVLDPDFGESAIGRVAPVDSGLWWIILLRAYGKITVTDGSCMIDRRMGIHGHPLEIQALFYSALRSSREMLTVDDGSKNLVRAVNNRLSALSFHIREYYWVDMKKINGYTATRLKNTLQTPSTSSTYILTKSQVGWLIGSLIEVVILVSLLIWISGSSHWVTFGRYLIFGYQDRTRVF
ncbi:hypothetical protein MKX01_014399 [Papaver californicum]|nr:hypothetical protein MKX01_014399 [Papaver californicum]